MLCTARVAPEKAVFRSALPLHFQPEFTGERQMAFKPYAEQLKDPRWQRKRLEVLNAADFTCEMCGDAKSTLHVHHKRYVKGRAVWDYDQNELQALCESCHAEHHEGHKLLEEVLATSESWDATGGALGLAAGYFLAAGSISDDLARRARAKAGSAIFDIGVIAYSLGMSNVDVVKGVIQQLTSQPISGVLVEQGMDNWQRVFEGEGE